MPERGKAPDRLAHTLGVIGFLLSVVSSMWQIFLHRESSAERATLRLSAFHIVKRGQNTETAAKSGFLSVEVVNFGQRPVSEANFHKYSLRPC